MTDDDSEIELSLRGLSWESKGKSRTLIYNLTVPLVKNNVDMCLFNLSPDELQSTEYKSAKSYIALGELKGGKVHMPVYNRRMLPLAAAALATVACVLTSFFSRAEESRIVLVKASEGWQSTGLRVRAGDHLRIRYIAGQWSPWPGGSYDAAGSGGDPLCRCNVMEAASHAALIGRIGGADPFLVGRKYDHSVGESGMLFLRINDADLYDNSGELEVFVELER